MSVRQGPHARRTIFAQITAPSNRQAPFLPLHRGGGGRLQQHHAELHGRIRQWIYLTPMVLGGIADGARRWLKFLGIGNPAPVKDPWILSMPWGAGFGRPTQRLSCWISKKKMTTFSSTARQTAQGDESAVDEPH